MILNFDAVASMKYKRNLIQGFIHRVWNACSTWHNFDKGVEEAKAILNENQYPNKLTDSIISKTIANIYTKSKGVRSIPENSTECQNRRLFFIQYQGHHTDKYIDRLKNSGALVKPIITLRKIKTMMPSLKPKAPKELESKVIYEYTCSRCYSTYVGKTIRHLKIRVKEHARKEKEPKKKHYNLCKESITQDNFKILYKTQRGNNYLIAIEALFIREKKPNLNTKDEFRDRKLRLKFFE